MRVRLPFAVLVAAAAFAGGVASSHSFESDARAQASREPATVYVPPEGLTFRAADGRIIARLAYDRHGGSFEVYDDHERPAAALRGGTPDVRRASAAPPTAPPDPFALPSATPDLGY